jgi:hypothetical protein
MSRRCGDRCFRVGRLDACCNGYRSRDRKRLRCERNRRNRFCNGNTGGRGHSRDDG